MRWSWLATSLREVNKIYFMIANKTSFFFKDFYKTKVVTYTIDINKNVHSEFLKHVEGWVIFGHGPQRPEIIGKSADAEFLAAAWQTKLFFIILEMLVVRIW